MGGGIWGCIVVVGLTIGEHKEEATLSSSSASSAPFKTGYTYGSLKKKIICPWILIESNGGRKLTFIKEWLK